MKIAYVTNFEAKNLAIRDNWSGLGYYIAQSLKNQDITVEYMGPLQDPVTLQTIRKLKSRYYKLFYKKNYQKDADPLTLKNYASQVAKKLNSIKSDIVFSATVNPIAYLECKQPIVFWADATCAGLVDFYPQYTNLCQESLKNWHMMERLALQKCKLAIYASEWAAQTAIDYYNVDPEKVKVVPFGANIDSFRTIGEIKDLIESRPLNKCKLLFLGVDWYRKGGDVALKVAEELNNLGLNTELTVVGCQPIVEGSLPSFVKPLGFISKSTIEGKERINQLLAESHFLIVPSRAECYGVVFCEANSLGVPCISRKVGGIPTIIRPNVNGNLFDIDASITEYCNYILRLFANYADYKELALSAFNEYKSRLNWKVAGQKIKELLITIT
jgi:glycosyltransferase involved in cell wall biosynthesis